MVKIVTVVRVFRMLLLVVTINRFACMVARTPPQPEHHPKKCFLYFGTYFRRWFHAGKASSFGDPLEDPLEIPLGGPQGFPGYQVLPKGHLGLHAWVHTSSHPEVQASKHLRERPGARPGGHPG